MSTSQIKALEDFVRLLDRNALSHAIRTAVDLGVLAELEGGQKTLLQLAEKLALNAGALELLMSVLCHTELVEKYGDDYALSTVARLIPPQFRDLGDHYWQYLREFIRSGKSLPRDEELPVTEADFANNWASTEWTQTPAAMDAAEALGIGSTLRDLEILEIGCGASVFGAAIAHRDPGSHLTLLDRAVGLKRAETTVQGVGLETRSDFVEADYRSDEGFARLDREQKKFDLIIAAGIAHRHNEDEIVELLKQLARVMATQGKLALIDVFPGQTKGNLHREIFQLELRLRTEQGRLYHPAEIDALLNTAGFQREKFIPLPSAPHIWGMVVAERGTELG